MAEYKILFESDSNAIDTDDFIVTEVTGHDWMSRPYRFDIDLVSEDPNLDLTEVLKNRAKLTIKQGYEEDDSRLMRNLNYFGIVATAIQTGRDAQWYSYRVTLVPEFMKLARIKRSRVFQGKSPLNVIKDVLDEYSIQYNMANLNGAFQEIGDAENKDFFVVQYNETDFDFISRWLEHEGIYYYWVQDDGASKEVLYFGNTASTYGTIPGAVTSFKYDPQQEAGAATQGTASVLPNIVAGLANFAVPSPQVLVNTQPVLNSNWYSAEVIREFSIHHKLLPNKVVLRDYNYEEATVALEAEAEVDPNSTGDIYEIDFHFRDEARGDDLATARAEAIKARKTRIAGVSDARGFRAGGLFRMHDHFKSDLNSGAGSDVDFLVTYVQHHIKQEPAATGGAASSVEYGNSFEAVPALDVIFGPDRLTAWPKIAGNMTATIEAAEGGDYSNLDTQGRYLVKLPLDLRTGAGPSSCRIRKAEGSGGNGYGMHFPGLPGDEVVLSFINGDPDRPIIAGMVSNTSNSSVVSDGGPTMNRISTPAGSVIEMDDTRGAQRIFIHTVPSLGSSPNTAVHLDAAADAETLLLEVPDQTIKLDNDNDCIQINSSSPGSSLIRAGKNQGEPASGNISGNDGILLSTDGDLNQLSAGDHNLTTSGNFNVKVDGAEDKKIGGDASKFVMGNAYKVTIGATEDAFFGVKMGLFVGATIDVKAAAALGVTVGGSIAITKAAKLSLGSETEYKFNQGKIVAKSMLDQELTSGLGKIKVEALVGDVEISSGAGKVEITAPRGIVLKCGTHEICVGPMGIKLQSGGTRFTLNGTTAKLRSTSIEIKANGSLTCQGTPGGSYK